MGSEMCIRDRCPDLVDPCRAKYFRAVPLMIRAVPNIAVPCPHDPCPDLVDPCRAAQEGFQKYGALFCGKKKRLRQRTHKPRASRNMGPFFVEKKGACGNVPTSQGLPEIWGPFFWKKKAPAATYLQVKGFQKFGPLGIQAEKQGFRTAWLITGQKKP